MVDEDSQAKTLVRLLRAASHDVLTATEAGLISLSDEEVLAHAIKESRTLLTRNCGDFLALAAAGDHPGILCVYQGQDPAKNMSYRDIVRAIGNVESAGAPVAGQFIALNAWSW